MHENQDVAFLVTCTPNRLAGDFKAGVVGFVRVKGEFEFLDQRSCLALVELIVEELDRVALLSLGDLHQAQFVVAVLVGCLAELVEAGCAVDDSAVRDYEHAGAPDVHNA